MADLSQMSDDELLRLRDSLVGGSVKSAPGLSGMSDEQLIAMREKLTGPQGSSWAGAAKTVPAALERGAYNLAGMFGNFNDLGKMAANWAAQKMGASPEDISRAAQARQFDPMSRLFDALPNSKDVQGAVEKFTGPRNLYEPQGRGEKTLDTTIQLGMGLGKPTPAMIGKVLAPTVAGTEIAGALTDDNPLWRAGGGLLGGGAAAGVNAWRNVPQKVVQQAVGDISPAQIAAAKSLEQQGRNMGVPLMGAESMPNSGIQQLASDVMASRTGSPIIRQFLESRPEGVRNAVGNLLSQMGPQRTPEASAGLAQKAATGAIQGAETARTNAVNPFYQAAANDTIPPKAIANVEATINAQRPNYPMADQQAALDAYLAGLQKLPPTKNAVAMDNLYRDARDSANVGTIGVSSADKRAVAPIRPVEAELRAASETSPNIKAGRDLYAQITRDQIDPLVAGPVGRVAGYKSGGFDPSQTPPVQRVTGELSSPAMARPETIRELHTALNKQDPQAFPAIARTWLENAFDQSTKRVQAGENVKLGANFNNDVRGTDFQRANFDEVLRGVAKAQGKNPDALVKGANVLLDTLGSTGKVPGVGSQTAGRLGTQAELSRNALSSATDIVSARPLAMLGRAWDSIANGRNNAVLANWFTDPNSVDILVKMAKLKPDGTTARFYVIQLLNASKEINQETVE